MSKLVKIDPLSIYIWVNNVTNRVMAKVWIDGKFHEVAFPNKLLTVAEIVESLNDWDWENNCPLPRKEVIDNG